MLWTTPFSERTRKLSIAAAILPALLAAPATVAEEHQQDDFAECERVLNSPPVDAGMSLHGVDHTQLTASDFIL